MKTIVIELSEDDVQLVPVYSFDSHEYGSFIYVKVVPKVVKGVSLKEAWNEWLREHNAEDLPELLEDDPSAWQRYEQLKKKFVETHVKLVYKLSEEAVNKLWFKKVSGHSPKLQYLKDWKIETIIKK